MPEVLTQVPQPNLNQPVNAYIRRDIAGFTVLVHCDVFKHSPEAAKALRELEAQARQIIRVVPAQALAHLRRVRIWLEWENKPNGAAEYHPSAVWLKQHGYNPEKAGGIEISNARNFVKWSRGEQPWMLLHEMAHAFHHQVLGYDNRMVRIAYRHALRRGLYEQVDHIRGGKKRAYPSRTSRNTSQSCRRRISARTISPVHPRRVGAIRPCRLPNDTIRVERGLNATLRVSESLPYQHLVQPLCAFGVKRRLRVVGVIY